jgi:hypothetical protein
MSERFYKRVKENVISKDFLPDKNLEERVNYKVLDILGAGRLNRFFLKHKIGLKGKIVTEEIVANRILKEGLAYNLGEAEREASLLLNKETIPINASSGADIVQMINNNDKRGYQLWCGFLRKSTES